MEANETRLLQLRNKFKKIDTKRYNALIHVDLTDMTGDDIRDEIIQDGVERIRLEIYDKMRQLPREQIMDNLEEVYNLVKVCLDSKVIAN